MKKEKGISLITLIILIAVIIGVIIFIVANNQGNVMADIEWGYMPSTEYYELRVAAAKSAISNGTGTLSLESFNTLGRDVKKAGGKWFKKSNVNFRTKILDDDTGEMVTLTDGEHVAVFTFNNGNNYVDYVFADEDFLEAIGMSNYNLLGGYKITIK